MSLLLCDQPNNCRLSPNPRAKLSTIRPTRGTHSDHFLARHDCGPRQGAWGAKSLCKKGLCAAGGWGGGGRLSPVKKWGRVDLEKGEDVRTPVKGQSEDR